MKGRAVLFNEPLAPMRIGEYTVPDPLPGDAIIKINMSNVCGSDVHIWKGELNLKSLGLPLPTIIGHEMVGTIHTLGSELKQDSSGLPLKEGDRVIYSYFKPCGHCRACVRNRPAECINSLNHISITSDDHPHFIGAFADYYYLHSGQMVFKVPEHVHDELVVSINCAVSQMMYAFDQIHPSMSDNIVIQGAGGLSLYAIPILKEKGVHRIFVIDKNQKRLDLASEFGADFTININDMAKAEDRISFIKEHTDGWGADIIIEVTGVPAVVQEGIEMLGSGGNYIAIGNVTPGDTFDFAPSSLVLVNKKLLGIRMYDSKAMFNALNFVVKNRKKYPFEKITGKKFGLDSINEAFSEAASGNVYRAVVVP